MKADLMGWMSKFRQYPELLSAYSPCNKVIHIIPHCIVGHWPFYNIIRMLNPPSAVDSELQPFFCHLIKRANVQAVRLGIAVYIYNRFSAFCQRPASGLLFQRGTVKNISEVFIMAVYHDLRLFYNDITSVII